MNGVLILVDDERFLKHRPDLKAGGGKGGAFSYVGLLPAIRRGGIHG